MTGETDPTEFVLAEKLGRTVEELRQTISPVEYIQWRAFYVYRAAMDERSWKEQARG